MGCTNSRYDIAPAATAPTVPAASPPITSGDAGAHSAQQEQTRAVAQRLKDIDRQIRTTQIQLEFCIETFDPNARKYSEAKKNLLKQRAQLDAELRALGETASDLTEASYRGPATEERDEAVLVAAERAEVAGSNRKP